MENRKVFTVKGPLYDISCFQYDWKHITNNHEIMEANKEAIKDTLEKPLCIYNSNQWTNRQIYFGKTDKATYGDKFYTKVVVEMPDTNETEGRLISAWPQKDIKGNVDERRLLYVDRKLGRKK